MKSAKTKGVNFLPSGPMFTCTMIVDEADQPFGGHLPAARNQLAPHAPHMKTLMTASTTSIHARCW